MRIGVLGNEGSWYVRDLERAAAAAGHELQRLDFPRLTASCGGAVSDVVAGDAKCTAGGSSGVASARVTALRSRPAGRRTASEGRPAGRSTATLEDSAILTAFDAVIVRTMPPGSLEQVVYRMDALAHVEAAGVCVLNPPKAIECAVDKYLATWRLEAADLPVPPTIVCETARAALDAFERLGGDVVVKPLFGSEGRGILRVSDFDLALRTFRTLERIDAVLYVQKFISHDDSDVRVLVLGEEVLGAIRRRSDGGFRTNISQNGRAEPHAPTGDERNSALAAAQAVGAAFAGVDLLYDADGTGYVVEVNAVPGWRAFARATGIDVAAQVLREIESRIKRNG